MAGDDLAILPSCFNFGLRRAVKIASLALIFAIFKLSVVNIALTVNQATGAMWVPSEILTFVYAPQSAADADAVSADEVVELAHEIRKMLFAGVFRIFGLQNAYFQRFVQNYFG